LFDPIIPYGYQGDILSGEAYFNAHFHHQNVQSNVEHTVRNACDSVHHMDVLDADWQDEVEEEEEEDTS